MAVFYGIFVQQLAAVVLCLLFFLTCWYYWSHRKILRAARKLPPVTLAFPILGHGHLALRGINGVINFGINLIKDALSSGTYDKGVFWVGPYPFFIITDPEEVHTLLNSTKSFEGGIESKFLGYALGNGLITAPVPVWKVTRRHVNTLFHPRNLEQLLPVLNDCARELVSSLNQHVSKGQIDVEPLVYPIALKSTCKLIFGPDSEVDTRTDKFKNLMTALTRLSQVGFERFVKIYAWPNSMFKLLYKKEIKQIEDGCDGFVVEAIQAHRKRKQLKNTSTQFPEDIHNFTTDNNILESDANNSDGLTSSVTLEDTYDTLRETHPTFTDKDMIYEMRNILFGGSESTRVTLSACLLALAAHPHVQEKLYAEVMTVVGSQDSDVTAQDIRDMPYLDQVLKETLRRFIVIPMVTRRVQEDLSMGDWMIPSGSLVGALTFGVHFNPKYYPDPKRFDPDRFTPENVAARGKHSFIPFSSGPRNCIGKNYSMTVLKTLLVHILRGFRFSTTVDIDSLQLVGGVVCGLADGYLMEVHPRQKTPSREFSGPLDQEPSLSVHNGRCMEGRFRD